MIELLSYDVINGSRTQHNDAVGLKFKDKKEMDDFRKETEKEHPECYIALTYRDVPVLESVII